MRLHAATGEKGLPRLLPERQPERQRVGESLQRMLPATPGSKPSTAWPRSGQTDNVAFALASCPQPGAGLG